MSTPTTDTDQAKNDAAEAKSPAGDGLGASPVRGFRPHDLLYNPTTCPRPHWWANSASCTIWQGYGKERKVAQCDDPGTAALICRLQWAAIDSANAHDQGHLPGKQNSQSTQDSSG
jgi:hypothetical protein